MKKYIVTFGIYGFFREEEEYFSGDSEIQVVHEAREYARRKKWFFKDIRKAVGDELVTKR